MFSASKWRPLAFEEHVEAQQFAHQAPIHEGSSDICLNARFATESLEPRCSNIRVTIGHLTVVERARTGREG
jgi:hypothetical protein